MWYRAAVNIMAGDAGERGAASDTLLSGGSRSWPALWMARVAGGAGDRMVAAAAVFLVTGACIASDGLRTSASLSAFQDPDRTGAAVSLRAIDPAAYPRVQPTPRSVSVLEDSADAIITLVRDRVTTDDLPAVTMEFATRDGSAAAGVDYEAVTGVVEFAVNEVIKYIRVPILHDAHREDPEWFTFGLLHPEGSGHYSRYWHSSQMIWIIDDDVGFHFEKGVGAGAIPMEVDEASSALWLTVIRGGGGWNTVSVDYETVDVTATAGEDYLRATGTLGFAPGVSRQSIILPLVNDLLPEGEERFEVRLLNPSTNAVLADATNLFTNVTIRLKDNDLGVVFESPSLSVDEKARSVEVTVLKGSDPPMAATVAYRVAGVTASATLDFEPAEGILEFAASEDRRTLTIPIVDDYLFEGVEIFSVYLTDIAGVPVGEMQSMVVAIVDDEEGAEIVDREFRPEIPGSVQRIVAQPDGRIVVGGNFFQVQGVQCQDFCRLLPDGGLDPGFQSHIDVGRHSSHSSPWGTLSVDELGRILIAGAYLGLDGHYRPGLFRLLADGALDLSFAPGFVGVGWMAAPLRGGGVVFGGSTNGVFGPPQVIVKLDDLGAIDPRFAPPEVTWWAGAGPGFSREARLFVDSSNRIVVTHAIVKDNIEGRWPLIRLLEDGSLDASFQPPVGNVELGPVLQSPDNSLLVATRSQLCFDLASQRYCGDLFRLNPDGTVDPRFRPPLEHPPITSMAAYGDGRIVLGYRTGPDRAAIQRLFPDGTLDPTLGPVWFGSGDYDAIYAIATLPDGGIVAGGGNMSLSGSEFATLYKILETPTPRIVETRMLAGSILRVSVSCAAGVRCGLEASSDLVSWTEISSQMTYDLIVNFTVQPTSDLRFYRAQVSH